MLHTGQLLTEMMVEVAPQPAAIPQAILEGFDRHYRLFRYVAQQAKSRYESGAWRRMQEAARSRIDFYDQRANEAVARVREGKARLRVVLDA